MCYARPRPRCKEHVQKKIVSRTKIWQEAVDKHGADHPRAVAAKTLLSDAISELDSTEGGQQDLQDLLDIETGPDGKLKNTPEVEALLRRKERGELTYKLRMLAGQEDDERRPEAISVLFSDAISYYDKDEVSSIISSTREMNIKVALRNKQYDDNLVPADEYHAFLDNLEDRIKQNNEGEVPEESQNVLTYLRGIEAPAKSNMDAYMNIDRSLLRGKEQLEQEIIRVGAIQGVPPKVAAAFYEGYREQYNQLWAGHAPETRPDPPQHWVEGTLSGYRHSYNTALAPSDPASMYALYKLRADPNAIPQQYKIGKRNYVSVNLVTADKATTKKSQEGQSEIIGISMVEYTPEGVEVDKYRAWVKPSQQTIQNAGEIAKEQHINVKELKDSPQWGSIAPEVRERLKGRTLLSSQQQQTVATLNSNLEGGYRPGWAAIDVTDVATKHFSQMNKSLATSVDTMRLGDEVAARPANMEALTVGEVFFEQQKKLRASWNRKDERKQTPNLEVIPHLGRWA